MDDEDEYGMTAHAVTEGIHLPATTRPPDGKTITVNGREIAVRTAEIDHGKLVRLAFPDAPFRHGASMSVTYRRGPAHAAEGILAPTESTPVTDGEVFVVTRTDKS